MKRSLRRMRVFFLLAIALAPSPFFAAAPPQAADQSESGRSALEASDIPPDAAHYTVLFFGKEVGVEGVWKNARDTWRFHYEFNERGHGPWIDETLVVGRDGLPKALDLSGHDELEAATADRFRRSGSSFRWKNAIEQGDSSHAGYYLSAPVVHEQVSAVPEEVAMLARALLRSPGRKLDILPQGEAQLVRADTVEVSSKDKRKKVVRYEISGLDFQPTSVWLEEDGTTFAMLGDLSLIQRGWEAALATLSKAEDEAAAARESELARRLARRAPAFAIVHVTLFDAATASLRPETTVVVRGDRIEAVGRDSEIAVPSDAEVVDARGKTLLPGLWDMHVHLEGNEGLISLAVGITTVRDMGNNVDEEIEMRRAFDEGSRLGPRMLLAGLIDGTGPYHSTLGVLAGTEDEARRAVDRYASLGFVQIKIYSSVPPALVPVIVNEAHAKGLRVSGHVPMHMLAQDAVQDGFDEIQHIYYVFLNFMPEVMNKDAPIGLVAALGDGATGISPDSDQVRSFLQLLKAHGTVIDPTLNAFESLLTARRGVPDPSMAAVLDRLPVKIRRSALEGGIPVPDGKDEQYRRSFQSCLAMTKALHDAGIPLVLGTDFLAGFTYQRELELHVAAGIPPASVLQAATLGSATIMKRDHDLGSIEAGKSADLVLIDGDPVHNISDIRHVSWVMKEGRLYSAPDLQQAIGVQPDRR